MFSKLAIFLLFVHQALVWCSPFPQEGAAQVSLGVGTPPTGVNIATSGGGSGGVTVGGGAGGAGAGVLNQRPHKSQYGMQYQNSGNFPIPFSNGLFSSMGGLGSSIVNAKTQSASRLMDGAAYHINRVPAFVGYGVQGVGRVEGAGEQLFKAAVDLGAGGLTNGMQGLALGMNMMNNLGSAGMKGLGKVANGTSAILEHILSLGVTESGLFNTLVALSRLMSPGQGSFLSNGLNVGSLLNAASYLGIPRNNSNLNTIIDSASKLQGNLANAGITMDSVSKAAQSASNVDLNSIRAAANSAVQNLGLSTAWNILSSRLSNSAPDPQAAANAIQAAAQSSASLPVPAVNANGVPGVNANVVLPAGSATLSSNGNTAAGGNTVQGQRSSGGDSWMSWLTG